MQQLAPVVAEEGTLDIALFAKESETKSVAKPQGEAVARKALRQIRGSPVEKSLITWIAAAGWGTEAVRW